MSLDSVYIAVSSISNSHFIPEN